MPQEFASKAQARTFRAIAHGWKPRGKAKGIPVSVAKRATEENKGKPQPEDDYAPVRRR